MAVEMSLTRPENRTPKVRRDCLRTNRDRGQLWECFEAVPLLAWAVRSQFTKTDKKFHFECEDGIVALLALMNPLARSPLSLSCLCLSMPVLIRHPFQL